MKLVLALSILTACGPAQVKRKPIKLPMISAPSSVPIYVTPKAHLDSIGLPSGDAPTVSNGLVCYGAPAHLRLAMSLKSARRLSDDRTALAWMVGWGAAQSEHLPIIVDLEQERIQMNAEASPRWEGRAMLLLGGLVVGMVVGALVGR